MVIVMVIAAFSSTMMCKAMALVPGNERFQVILSPLSLSIIIHYSLLFIIRYVLCHCIRVLPPLPRYIGPHRGPPRICLPQGRVEIEGLAKIFFNKWGYYLTLFLLIISLQATNISSIIISAQVHLS
jgi:hypothetical protein